MHALNVHTHFLWSVHTLTEPRNRQYSRLSPWQRDMPPRCRSIGCRPSCAVSPRHAPAPLSVLRGPAGPGVTRARPGTRTAGPSPAPTLEHGGPGKRQPRTAANAVQRRRPFGGAARAGTRGAHGPPARTGAPAAPGPGPAPARPAQPALPGAANGARGRGAAAERPGPPPPSAAKLGGSAAGAETVPAPRTARSAPLRTAQHTAGRRRGMSRGHPAPAPSHAAPRAPGAAAPAPR